MTGAAYLPAVAAFSGSASGMLPTVLSNWVAHRRNARTQHTLRHRYQRHKLYKQFIGEASRLYADALVTEGSRFQNLVTLYALIARMRVISSDDVVAEAKDPEFHRGRFIRGRSEPSMKFQNCSTKRIPCASSVNPVAENCRQRSWRG